MQSHSSAFRSRSLVPVSLVALIAACAGAAVTVNPYPAQPQVSTFPDGQPPTNPPLPPGAEADYTPTITNTPPVPTTTGTPPDVQVTDVTTTVSATGLIRIPASHNNPGDDLFDHEQTHHRISKEEYTNTATNKMDAAVRKVRARGYPTVTAARQATQKAVDAAMASIWNQIAHRNTLFDRFVDGGDSLADAYDKAMRAAYNAPLSGSRFEIPAEDREWAGTIVRPAMAFNEGSMHFASDLFVDIARNPFDPLCHYGSFVIGSVIPIGLNENGTVLLSDASFAVVSPAGEVLLRGALFQGAYMPSPDPQYAGMMQASLWIFPTQYGGIVNSINSPTLSEFSLSADGGELLTFWFYAPMPLLTAEGDQAMADGFLFPGSIRIGHAVTDTWCPADFNKDGGVDGDDVIAFFALWDMNDAAADFNHDGGVDGDDVIDFFGHWDSGC